MDLCCGITIKFLTNQCVKSALGTLIIGLSLASFTEPSWADAPKDIPVVPVIAPNDTPVSFVEFILEDEANCQSRDSQHVIVHSTHPSRIVRVWLDRYYRNVPTGDRSRTDLKPGAEPEGLGCATVMNAKQEWRIVKAIFVD